MAGVVPASAALAGPAPLGEPHLAIVPRTAAETARIGVAVAPTQTFDAPEQFETHPAGAATLFGDLDADAFSYGSGNMSEDDPSVTSHATYSKTVKNPNWRCRGNPSTASLGNGLAVTERE